MRQDWNLLSLVTQLGITMVVCILLGTGVGLWIDGHFGTRPWGLLIFSLIGTAAGTIAVYRLVSATFDEAIRRQRNKERDNGRDE